MNCQLNIKSDCTILHGPLSESKGSSTIQPTVGKNSQDWVLKRCIKIFHFDLHFKYQYSYYDFKYYTVINETKNT